MIRMATAVLLEFGGRFPEGKCRRIFDADQAAKDMKPYLAGHDIQVTSEDLWNDYGWYIACRYSGNEFFISLGW